jgi:hypothetical protein
MFKSVILICISVLLLIGNIGIPIYTHACKEDGVFRTIFFESKHCEEKQSQLPSCCQKEKSKKDDCCHNETKIIKLKADYSTAFSKIKVETNEIAFAQNNFTFIFSSTLFQNETKKYSGIDPPPRLSGRQILIQNQVFRI